MPTLITSNPQVVQFGVESFPGCDCKEEGPGIVVETEDLNFYVHRLRHSGTDDYVDDAVLTANLYDSAGVVVPNCLNISLAYQGAEGNYLGRSYGLTFVANSSYRLTISSSNYGLSIQRWYYARPRTVRARR